MKLGDLLGTAADRTAGMAHYMQALSLVDDSPLATLRIWSKVAYVQGEAYDPAAARDSFRRAEQAALTWLAKSPTDPTARAKAAFCKERIAWFSTLAGEPARAEDAILEAIATYKQLAAQSVPGEAREYAMAYKTLAEVQQQTGKTKEGLVNCRKSLEATEAMLPEDPQNEQFKIDIAQETVLLVDLLIANGERDEARERTANAIARLKPLALAADPNRYYLLDCVTLLVGPQFAQFATADDTIMLATKAVDMMQGEDPETLDLLARAYDHAGRAQDAVAEEQKAIAHLPPLVPGRPRDQRRHALDDNLARFQANVAKAGGKRPTQ
jgi:tetratricopeptide (TPR) repeat protein